MDWLELALLSLMLIIIWTNMVGFRKLLEQQNYVAEQGVSKIIDVLVRMEAAMTDSPTSQDMTIESSLSITNDRLNDIYESINKDSYGIGDNVINQLRKIDSELLQILHETRENKMPKHQIEAALTWLMWIYESLNPKDYEIEKDIDGNPIIKKTKSSKYEEGKDGNL